MSGERRWPIEICGACGHIVGTALLSGAGEWCPATGEHHEKLEAIHVVPLAALQEEREKREAVKAEREEWRGKAEHRLHEWRLRDQDVAEADAERDEKVAAADMWRERADKAEAALHASQGEVERLREKCQRFAVMLLQLASDPDWLEEASAYIDEHRALSHPASTGSGDGEEACQECGRPVGLVWWCRGCRESRRRLHCFDAAQLVREKQGKGADRG